jgi:hypothetical protein
MDWLWAVFEPYIRRERKRRDAGAVIAQSELQEAFFSVLSESTATLFAMEPVGETIRFKGLGQWPLAEVPALLSDPNAFIADQFGGGKFKINFHHGATFVATHNFRTYGDPLWQGMQEHHFAS